MEDIYSDEALDALSIEATRKLKSQEGTTVKEEPIDYDYDAKEEAMGGYNLENMEAPNEGAMDDLYTVDIPPDEFETESVNEIFPGGPTEAMIGLWKKTYPDCYVFATEVSGQMFIARSITRLEYKKLISLSIDQLQREEVICSTCILFPYSINWQDVNGLRAGIPSTVASVIMENSGFTNEYGVQIL